MRSESIQQYAIVMSDSAEDLTEQLNAKLMSLKGKSPSVRFDGLIAYVSYKEQSLIPESTSDEAKLKGWGLHCSDCPAYEPVMKADGSIDARSKHGGCKYTEFGRTKKDANACDTLYEMLQSGEVRLCFSESE